VDRRHRYLSLADANLLEFETQPTVNIKRYENIIDVPTAMYSDDILTLKQVNEVLHYSFTY
jgi:hypothetical protein